MEMQMNMEDYFYNIGTIQKRDVIIISDRGCIDNLAYASAETRARVLREANWKIEEIRDQRYDAVIHLVTAADGAESFYTLSNNAARTETPEVARWIDKRTQEVWNGHPNLTVISNTAVANFQQKMDEAYKAICKVIDIPEEPSIVVKYLLKDVFEVAQLPGDLSYQSFHELIHYLPSASDDEHSWVKKRRSHETLGETYTIVRRKHSKVAAERLELARIINHRHYDDEVKMADPDCQPVEKDVVIFLHDNFHYHVETFSVAGQKLSILRCFTFDKTKAPVPSFLHAAGDITEDSRYFTSTLAGKHN